jgi:hypothetical protein
MLLQLSTQSNIEEQKCDGPQSTSAYTLTCKDPKIQELIEDCPLLTLASKNNTSTLRNVIVCAVCIMASTYSETWFELSYFEISMA